MFELYCWQTENSRFQTQSPRQTLLGVNFTPSRPCTIPQSHLNLLTQIKEGQSKNEIKSESPESFSHSSKRRCVRESAGDTGSERMGARGGEERKIAMREERESQWGTTPTSNTSRLTLHPSAQRHIVSAKSQKPISELQLSSGGLGWRKYSNIVWIQSWWEKKIRRTTQFTFCRSQPPVWRLQGEWRGGPTQWNIKTV